MIQHWAGIVSLIGGLIIIAVFAAVAVGARRSVPGARDAIYRARRYYALALGIAVLLGLILTLPHAPYPSFHDQAPAMRVDAIGRMWSWELRAEGATQPEPLVVPLGRPVEFNVTAADVNHGFGIYDPAGALVAQTQAMPGYVNRLTHTFDTPGTYRVLCLEYCGLAHHMMLSEFTVR